MLGGKGRGNLKAVSHCWDTLSLNYCALLKSLLKGFTLEETFNCKLTEKIAVLKPKSKYLWAPLYSLSGSFCDFCLQGSIKYSLDHAVEEMLSHQLFHVLLHTTCDFAFVAYSLSVISEVGRVLAPLVLHVKAIPAFGCHHCQSPKVSSSAGPCTLSVGKPVTLQYKWPALSNALFFFC